MVRLLVGAVSLTNFEPSAVTANSREKPSSVPASLTIEPISQTSLPSDAQRHQ
ncbi:MAG: hypothetical protein KA233_04790 [Novosphingobium sp.]|nr:hypothetical protein [Novosphingobium sp.]MBP6554977.1 hypothetical protein [Novosphingobium sp.]